ncbi:DMT family transporter [Nesterenkonia populi]
MSSEPKLLPLQFAALALAWGSSFLFIKIGLEGLSPMQVVTARMGIGALALLAILVMQGVRLPRSAQFWGHITMVSVFLCILPFSLFAWAGQFISSGLSSIFNATTPLMTLLVTLVALRTERPNRLQLIGLALGLMGALVVLAPWRMLGPENLAPLTAQLACLGATASYGVAFVYLRKFVSPLALPTVAVATAQVGVGAVVLVGALPLSGQPPMLLTPSVVASMLSLGIAGTGLAYIWNTNIVAGWGANVASSVTYLAPVVGVALGVLILGESVAWNQPIGALGVIAGIMITRRLPRIRTSVI